MQEKLSELGKLCRGRKILVVDDEKFSRGIVLHHLKDAGVAATVPADSTSEALQFLTAGPKTFCAVICDFNMPVLTGLHFLKAVRTGFEGIPNSLPVIMLTGFADSALVGAALQLDVDAFVVKPVSRATIESRLIKSLTGTSAVSPPSAYADIDVDSLSQAVLKPKATAPKAPVPVAEEPPPADAIPVVKLTQGMVLAQDLNAPSGELLLSKGFPLSNRMISRLTELSEMGIIPSAVRVQ